MPDQAMLLEDHPVCLFQFGGLYLPIGLDAGRAMAEGLSNMSQASMGPEREGMLPLEFDPAEIVELPLVTGAANESFQFGETVYMDVFFGDTRSAAEPERARCRRLCPGPVGDPGRVTPARPVRRGAFRNSAGYNAPMRRILTSFFRFLV